MGLTHTKEQEEEYFRMRTTITNIETEVAELKELAEHYRQKHTKTLKELENMTAEKNEWKKRALKAEAEIMSMKILLETAKTDLFLARKKVEKYDEMVKEVELKELYIDTIKITKKEEKRLLKELSIAQNEIDCLKLDTAMARDIIMNRTKMYEMATKEIDNLNSIISNIKKALN
jgi:hypothetical protein